jgi:hypothetical protein
MNDARPALRWRALLAIVCVAMCVATVKLLFRYVQIRIWNHLNWIDLVAMTALVAPFLASKWMLPPRTRAAQLAWWICALTALDVLAFAVGILAPSGGHPSLEAVVSVFIGAAKVALVPAALLSLVVAALRGERAATVVLGTLCLIGETLYTVCNSDSPLGWFAWLDVTGG